MKTTFANIRGAAWALALAFFLAAVPARAQITSTGTVPGATPATPASKEAADTRRLAQRDGRERGRRSTHARRGDRGQPEVPARGDAQGVGAYGHGAELRRQ